MCRRTVFCIYNSRYNHKWESGSQVHPDFSPRAPSGPGGDSFRRPCSTAVLAARTRRAPAGRPTAPPIPSLLGAASSLVHTAARSTSTESLLVTSSAATGRGGSTVPTTPTVRTVPDELDNSHLQEGKREESGSSSYASPTDRLWRRFSILALESPSTSELRSVFSRACSDAFAGGGSISSAVRGPTCRLSPDTTTQKAAVLITSEVWKAVDAMGGVTAEFLARLYPRLLTETSLLPSSSSCAGAADAGAGAAASRSGFHRESAAAIAATAELAACRLDYFTLQRLLRPLVLRRTGDISTPVAVQRFFCHEVCLSETLIIFRGPMTETHKISSNYFTPTNGLFTLLSDFICMPTTCQPYMRKSILGSGYGVFSDISSGFFGCHLDTRMSLKLTCTACSIYSPRTSFIFSLDTIIASDRRRPRQYVAQFPVSSPHLFRSCRSYARSWNRSLRSGRGTWRCPSLCE